MRTQGKREESKKVEINHSLVRKRRSTIVAAKSSKKRGFGPLERLGVVHAGIARFISELGHVVVVAAAAHAHATVDHLRTTTEPTIVRYDHRRSRRKRSLIAGGVRLGACLLRLLVVDLARLVALLSLFLPFIHLPLYHRTIVG